MATVSLEMTIRGDAADNRGTQGVEGWTEDEGATVTLDAGYLPGLALCQLPGDIVVTLDGVTRLPTSCTRSVDGDTQTLEFAYA